jgi:hypothetical protein
VNEKNWKVWVLGSGGIGFLAFLAIGFLTGYLDAAPGLVASRSTNNLLLITITNAASTNAFEVYGRAGLETQFSWSLISTGAVGQTNFLVPMHPRLIGFYRVALGNDWDGDGTPNWKDADPISTNAGLLSITIDNPANGSNLQ